MLEVLTFDTSLTKRKEIQENLRHTPPINRVSYSDFEDNETRKPDIFTRIS